jgi:hypothetical protein
VKSLYIHSLLLFIIIPVYAQQHLSGKVTSDSGEPLPNATVTIIVNDSARTVKNTLTDPTGSFQLQGLPASPFLLRIAMLGYKSMNRQFSSADTSSLFISLQRDTTMLKTLEVKASKPLFELNGSNLVVNVENSLLSGSSNAMEVLERAPGVTINIDNIISLEGKQGVNVTVNGKSLRLSGELLANYLKTLPGNQIKKIELMYTPSVKYDASGNAGMIDIQLKKPETEGLNGNIYINSAYGIYPRISSGIGLNYRSKQLNIYGNIDGSATENKYILKMDRTPLDVKDGSPSYHYRSTSRNTSKYGYLKLGADYQLNKKEVIGFLVNGFLNDGKSKRHSDNLINTGDIPDSTLSVGSSNHYRFDNFSANLNYKNQLDDKGSSLSMDLDYAYFPNNTSSLLQNSTLNTIGEKMRPDSFLRNTLSSYVNMASFKIDYTIVFPAADIKLETGIKSMGTKTSSNVVYENLRNEWTHNSFLSNQFDLREYIHAAYINGAKKFKSWSIQAGLRLEQTNTNAYSFTLDSSIKRNYLNAFPGFSMSTKISKQLSGSFSYSRRIGRPNFQDLNPFVKYLDPYTIEAGNPYLFPTYSNSFRIQLLYLNKYSFSIGYTNTNNLATVVYEKDTSTNITTIITKNLGKQANYSSSLNIPLTITSWWNMMTNITGFYNKSSYTDNLNSKEQHIDIFSVNINASTQFKMPFNLKAEAVWMYKSPATYGAIKTFANNSLSIGIQKSFAEGKTLLKVSLSDVFNTSVQRGSSSYDGQQVVVYQKPESRVVNVRFSYSFGSKKIKSARDRAAGLDEDKYRVGTN